MDRDRLRGEVEEWVEAEIITAEQGEEILSRYEEDEGGSRLVVVVSLMGAVLVGAGILWFLAGNWESIPRPIRTAVLLLAPTGFAWGSHALTGRRNPRVGHALWVLAAAFVGPSLYLLADLWTLEVDAAWLYLAWAILAVPAGHIRRSRPTTALGLLVAAAAVFTLESPTDLPVAVGFFGVVLFTLGVDREDRLEDAYRLVGAGLVMATLLFAAFEEWGYDRLEVEPSAVVVVTVLGAVAAVAGAWWLEREERAAIPDVEWTAAGTASLLLAVVTISAVPTVPDALAVAVVHAGLLVVVLSTVVAAVETNSTALVNLAAVAFLAQVLVLLGTRIVDATSGALALVFTGVTLLLVALGLERGRRRILERMRDRSGHGAEE